MAENRTVYSPAGDKYEAGSVAEVTRLLAYGYTQKKPTPTQIAENTGQTK